MKIERLLVRVLVLLAAAQGVARADIPPPDVVACGGHRTEGATCCGGDGICRLSTCTYHEYAYYGQDASDAPGTVGRDGPAGLRPAADASDAYLPGAVGRDVPAELQSAADASDAYLPGADSRDAPAELQSAADYRDADVPEVAFDGRDASDYRDADVPDVAADSYDGFTLPPRTQYPCLRCSVYNILLVCRDDAGVVEAGSREAGSSVREAGSSGGTGIWGNRHGSSGCAVGGWLSARTVAPWVLAGLFGAAVTLVRRRRL